MDKILVLWDDFGVGNGMEAYLFLPADDKQRKRLLQLHGAFINSTDIPDDHPVYKFSDMMYSKKKPLERFKIEWPIKLNESVVIVHSGFLP